jgi:NAD(P)-dependent dehydrogenase (short-subunit alcohol dehydrogenase family)
MADRLRGKRALITGAASGIGRGCAEVFAREGAHVMAADLNWDGLVDLAEAVPGIACRKSNLTDPADVERLLEETVATLGGLDCLVNAAAVADFQWIGEMDYERHWRRTITGELDTVFLACKAAWTHLKTQGGAIVNLASANAYVALKNSPALAHTAGKGGVLAMTRQLAMEGAAHGIRANTISPGMIVTAATAAVLENPALKASVEDKLMVGRLGRPEDIAWGAVYLCSDEAGYVTGTDLSIDGGALAW